MPGAALPLVGAVTPLVGGATVLVELVGAEADATAVIPPPRIAIAAIPPIAASLRWRLGRTGCGVAASPIGGMLFVMMSFRWSDELLSSNTSTLCCAAERTLKAP
jgi:hypothetical protein